MLTLAQIGSGIERIVARLPGAIRKPVEREWRPLQELFLRRRAPRLLFIGDAAGVSEWIHGVFGIPQVDPAEMGISWMMYKRQGKLEYFVAGNESAMTAAIQLKEPDLFVYLGASESPATAGIRGNRPLITMDPRELHREYLLKAMAALLPLETKLEFARESGEKTVQGEIASMLTRSTSAICAGIGAQPIPLADFPILTSLQVLMVTGIIYTSGREWSRRLALDFLTALGANVGAGLLLREGVRAALKMLPGWGNAISGAIAGAGTFAIGRAAKAYFVEGRTLTETRSRFQRGKRKKHPPELPG